MVFERRERKHFFVCLFADDLWALLYPFEINALECCMNNLLAMDDIIFSKQLGHKWHCLLDFDVSAMCPFKMRAAALAKFDSRLNLMLIISLMKNGHLTHAFCGTWLHGNIRNRIVAQAKASMCWLEIYEVHSDELAKGTSSRAAHLVFDKRSFANSWLRCSKIDTLCCKKSNFRLFCATILLFKCSYILL